MKFLIVIFALFGCAFAQFGGGFRGFPSQRPFTQTQRPYQPQPQPPQYQPQPQQPQYYPNNGPQIAIRSQTQDSSPDGSYNFSYETENGISVSETGSPKGPVTPEGQSEVVQGRYSYTAPDGTPITVEYYADETGFHPTGAHLPTPPPIPAAIQRSLAVLPQTRDEEPVYQQQPQQYNRPVYNQVNPFRRF